MPLKFTMEKSNGGKPSMHARDELDFLKDIPPEKLEKVWENCKPVIKPVGRVVITGTLKTKKR